MIRRFVEGLRRLLPGGKPPQPSAPIVVRGPVYHLPIPGTARARCGEKAGPLVILTVEMRMVGCLQCRREGLALGVRIATGIR